MKKKIKEELPSVEEMIAEYLKKNPNATEEEITKIKKVYEIISNKSFQRKINPSRIFSLIKNFAIYFITLLAMTGFFCKAIALEPFWLVFPIILGLAVYFSLFKLVMYYINLKVGNSIWLLIVGVVFNIVCFLILNQFALMVFKTKIELIIYFVLVEAVFMGIKYILLRLSFRNFMR